MMDSRIITAGVTSLVVIIALGTGAAILLSPDSRTVVPSPVPSPLLIAPMEHPQSNDALVASRVDPPDTKPPATRPAVRRSGVGSETRPPPSALVTVNPPVSAPAEPKDESQVAARPEPPEPHPEQAPAIAPPIKPVPHVVDHRYDGALTMTEIARFKSALRLTREQDAFWPPVASLLRELGRLQMAQIDAGQKLNYAMSSDMMQRFYSAASPLLQTLREDQKDVVRKRAKIMGLEAYASYI